LSKWSDDERHSETFSAHQLGLGRYYARPSIRYNVARGFNRLGGYFGKKAHFQLKHLILDILGLRLVLGAPPSGIPFSKRYLVLKRLVRCWCPLS